MSTPRRLSHNGSVLRKLDLFAWFMVALTLFMVGIAGFYAGHAIDLLRAQYLGGVAGTVSVVDCEWDASTRGGSWECWGEFTSDDRLLSLPEVVVRPNLDEWPEEPVATLVSGASASRAHLSDPRWAWVRISLLPVLLYCAGSSTWQVWKKLTELRQDSHLDVEPDEPHPVSWDGWEQPATRPWPALAPALAPEPSPEPGSGPGSGPLPGNSKSLVVVGCWALLLLATGGVLWESVAWNRAQDALLSEMFPAEVVATHIGPENRIEVGWTGYNDEPASLRLTPLDPDHVSVGDTVLLRYNPDSPDGFYEFYPVEADAYDLPIRVRNMWTGLLLVPGFLLAWAWTWRLARWVLGALRPGLPVAVEVLAAWSNVGYGRTWPGPAGYWLRIQPELGEPRYQRASWHPRLVPFLASRTGAGPAVVSVARSCPGLRRMYIIDLPGVGRIWPASTARPGQPRNYDLAPLDPARPPPSGAGGRWWLAGLVPGALLTGWIWLLAGPVAAAYPLVLIGSLWLRLGGWLTGAAPRVENSSGTS